MKLEKPRLEICIFIFSLCLPVTFARPAFLHIGEMRIVAFDQNGQNAICADFEVLAVSLPDLWLLRTKNVIGTIGQTVRAGIF